MSSPIDREDPGLQPERTLRAWQRTLILLVVVGLLFLRGELTTGANPIPQAPPVVRMALMIAFLFVAAIVGLHLWLRWRRSREGLRDPAGTGGPPRAVSASAPTSPTPTSPGSVASRWTSTAGPSSPSCVASSTRS